MIRGSVCLLSLAVACGAFAGISQPDALLSTEAALNTAKVEMLLPPGTDLAGVRGSLSVEKFPVTARQTRDGASARTLPVVYTFVNQWNETFMFDGYNQAVLTDVIGTQHFADAVVRNNRLLEAGVSGLVGPGHTVEFTVFYDLDEAYADTNLEEVKLDLRYLNHGHPYRLSAIISSYAGLPLASGAWNVAGEPGVEERPEIVPVAPAPRPQPVEPKPVVVPPPAPAPKPAPIVEQPRPIAPPPAPPAPVILPPQPVAPPPAPVVAQQPKPMPLPVKQGPCNPCFMPCCICIPLPNVGGFVCCVFDKVGNLVCCTTNAACGLVHGTLCLADNLVCGSLKTVCCVTGAVLKGTCKLLGNVTGCLSCSPGCPPGGGSFNPCGMVGGVVSTALSPLNCLGLGGGGCGVGACGVM